MPDTGIFDAGRYHDVTVEYGKAAADDLLLRVTVVNRSPDAARLHLPPQLWARNTWSWTPDAERLLLRARPEGGVLAAHPGMQPMILHAEPAAALLFCENETNIRRLYGGEAPGPFKDGINDCVVHGDGGAVSRLGEGTKCAVHHLLDLPPGGSAAIRLRLRPATSAGDPFADFDAVLAGRLAEADEFYAVLQRGIDEPDARLVQRQALAGMLWSKQFYSMDVPRWLAGDEAQPPPPEGRRRGRNAEWLHMNNADIISVPDKWEYPWYAAWDLAFHCVTLGRSRLRQAAARPSDARVVHAPERATAGL